MSSKGLQTHLSELFKNSVFPCPPCPQHTSIGLPKSTHSHSTLLEVLALPSPPPQTAQYPIPPIVPPFFDQETWLHFTPPCARYLMTFLVSCLSPWPSPRLLSLCIFPCLSTNKSMPSKNFCSAQKLESKGGQFTSINIYIYKLWSL